jgi:hypothetical protein
MHMRDFFVVLELSGLLDAKLSILNVCFPLEHFCSQHTAAARLGCLETMHIDTFGDIWTHLTALPKCSAVLRKASQLQVCGCAQVSEIFMLSNYQEDDLNWSDWDWNMSYEEFQEAIARVAYFRSGYKWNSVPVRPVALALHLDEFLRTIVDETGSLKI